MTHKARFFIKRRIRFENTKKSAVNQAENTEAHTLSNTFKYTVFKAPFRAVGCGKGAAVQHPFFFEAYLHQGAVRVLEHL